MKLPNYLPPVEAVVPRLSPEKAGHILRLGVSRKRYSYQGIKLIQYIPSALKILLNIIAVYAITTNHTP